MGLPGSRTVELLYVLVAALAVYVVAHWHALTNPYVLNDDVRQQIFWMQQWLDPELYPDDLLTRYARNYVPWGVQAIYAMAAHFMNPVQFSKVLTGILYIITAGFVFGLALQFRDDVTAVLAACVYFLFGGFLNKISGGLSQSFVFPLLVAYLFFLGRNQIGCAGIVLMVQPLLNPYAFLLCVGTHAIFMIYNYGPMALGKLGKPLKSHVSPAPMTLGKLLLVNLPVAIGLCLMVLEYLVFADQSLGKLVSRADMMGKIEYTAAGRYELWPVTSFFYELIDPWVFNLPFREWGNVAGWVSALLVVVLFIYALRYYRPMLSMSGFRVFGYLFPASLILYFLAYALLLKLFIPSRYIEYSLTLFYCMATAVALRLALENLGLRRIAFPVITTLLIIVAAVRSQNVGIYDYSADADLYRFFETTPKNSLVAGQPELMDNVLTFSRRKALVTYELSHTWVQPYWDEIKRRTFDFFRAYYSGNPDEIREFCRKYRIDYLVVRDEDFPPVVLKKDPIYFEPFDSFIRDLLRSGSRFALLDPHEFPPVYQQGGIRVIKMR